MNRTLGRFRMALVTGLVVLSLAAFAGSASAAPGAGFTGACNMLHAAGVGTQGGMVNAMTVNNPNGNLGMWRAVANTSISGLEECPSN